MPDCNRVTPFGDIVAIRQRGLYMGNRGSIHRGRAIIRPWQVRRWITCELHFKNWVAPKWQPGRWTPLFFWDEAVALAAGHRPCALCRRSDFNRWTDAWERATGTAAKVDAMDRTLHDERTTADRRQRRHRAAWADLPTGAFAVVDDDPALVLSDRLVLWQPSPEGYGRSVPRPRSGSATVLTPPATLAVLRHGYVPALHPSAHADYSAPHHTSIRN